MLDLTMQAIQASLDGLAARQRVIADNLANSETPGYTAQTVSFENSLSSAIGSGDPTQTSITPGVTNDVRDGLGNNVSVDGETLNTVRPMSQPAFQERFIVAQEIPNSPGSPVGVGGGVEASAVEFGDSTGIVTYDPNNPLADQNGLVRRPDVNLGDQMTSLILAQRAYQLNLAVVDRAKESYQQALQINGR
jgi:flagellar basal-body rod protein FlgC